MRSITAIGLFTLLISSRVHGDVTAPAPLEITLDDAVIDLAAHRVVRHVAGGKTCGMEDGPYRRLASSPIVTSWTRQVAHEESFAASTAHHLLLHNGFWSDKPHAVVIDLDAKKVLTHLDGRGDALVERPDGSLIGILSVDSKWHDLTLSGVSGQRIWEQRIPTLWADSATVLVDGNHLVIALFNRIATGSALLAVDLKTGAPIWTAEVRQLNVPHSKYFNDISLERMGSEVVMRGFEAAGCYLQMFDLATGKRTFAQLPKWVEERAH